jgi:hypothetical protein
MAVQTITYEDKQYLNENANISAINKVQDTDMNEIKAVVNNNANETNTNTNDIANILNAEIYSTNEIKTNKVWINGKPIYRKVIEKTIASQTEQRYTLESLGISNVEVMIINVGESTAYYGSGSIGNSYSPISYYVSSSDRAHVFFDGSSKVTITNLNASQRTYYITLEYTKTTD